MKDLLNRTYARLALLIAFAATFFAAALSWAQDAGVAATQPGVPPIDVAQTFSSVIVAIAAKNWWLLASIGLTVGVWLLRKYLLGKIAFFKTTIGGWVMNFGIALITALAASFAVGHHAWSDIFDAAVAALKIGAGGSTLYTAIQDMTGATSKPATAASPS
jgi:hypothetical protein